MSWNFVMIFLSSTDVGLITVDIVDMSILVYRASFSE